MKIARGYFDSYRNVNSNVLNEAYNRTRYFSASGMRSASGTTVFISHKHSDLESAGDMKDLKGMLNYLKNRYNVVPYIDSMDNKMPKETCAETANRIKSVIDGCNKFLLLATNNAIASKWCNWEVGIADKKKLISNDMAILPMVESRDALYDGSEYLELYPYIEKRYDSYGHEDLYVFIRKSDGTSRWVSLGSWLNDTY